MASETSSSGIGAGAITAIVLGSLIVVGGGGLLAWHFIKKSSDGKGLFGGGGIAGNMDNLTPQQQEQALYEQQQELAGDTAPPDESGAWEYVGASGDGTECPVLAGYDYAIGVPGQYKLVTGQDLTNGGYKDGDKLPIGQLKDKWGYAGPNQYVVWAKATGATQQPNPGQTFAGKALKTVGNVFKAGVHGITASAVAPLKAGWDITKNQVNIAKKAFTQPTFKNLSNFALANPLINPAGFLVKSTFDITKGATNVFKDNIKILSGKKKFKLW